MNIATEIFSRQTMFLYRGTEYRSYYSQKLFLWMHWLVLSFQAIDGK